MTQATSVPPVSRDRPAVSEVVAGLDGRHFTVRFTSGQSLPPHRNVARVVITALAGSGEITVEGFGARALTAGVFVQLDPNVEHSVLASEDGLEIRVDLIARCCGCC